MVIVTGPEGDNFCFTNNNNAINIKDMIKKAVTVAKIVPVMPVANIMLLFI
jgi:hypothetical protein